MDWGRWKRVEEPDYGCIRELLTEQCRAVIRQFAATPQNRDVHCFSIMCDPLNGNYGIAIHTMEAFRKCVAESYSNEPEYSLGWLGGPKYNYAHCAYDEPGPTSQQFRAACKQWLDFTERIPDRLPEEMAGPLLAEHERRFVDQAVETIHSLGDAFTVLHRTEEFVAFVDIHDRPEEMLDAVFRRTVTPEQIARVFPYIAERDRLYAQLARRPVAEQADYWRDAWFDLVLERGSPLEPLGFHRYTVEDELVKLGPPAVPHLLQMAEHCSEQEDMGDYNLLNGVGDVARPDPETHDQLLRLLRHVLDLPHRPLSLSSIMLAGLLHRLFPARYPEPPLKDEATNRLLNPTAFGLEPGLG